MHGLENGFDYLSKAVQRDLVVDILDKKNGSLDLDWLEICERYDLSVSPETLRKAGVGIKLVADAGLINDGPSQSLMDRNYIERQKARDLIGKIKTAEREESRSELLRETVANAIQTLSPIRPLIDFPTVSHEGASHLVVCIGDIHFGAKIHVTGLYGDILNHYDQEEFERRMNKLHAEIVDILYHNKNIGAIDLLFVGDLIDGMLRQTQLMKLEYGVIESTIRLSEFLANWIARLTEYIPVVNVYGCFGNHSEIRPLGSKKGDFEDENMERIVFWYLKERLAGIDAVRVQNDCGKYCAIDICGFSFLLLHGDDARHIQEVARDAVNLYGKRIDFFVCGHLHREGEFPSGMTPDGGSIIVRTPSICGVDSYAHSKGYRGASGSTAMIIEPEYGRRCVYPIRLQ